MAKVIIIGPAYPLRGGLATFDERLARQCMLLGHEVKIYTFSLQYPNFLFPGKTQYSESPPPDGLQIEVCINSVNPLNWLMVAKKLDREAPDYIITRYWLPFMGPCLGGILKWMTNKKTIKIALVDNAIPHEKRPGDTWFTQYFVSANQKFVTMSTKVAKDLALFSDSDVLVKEHPLYDNFGIKMDKKQARAKLGIALDTRIFLFFGFIRHYKGLDILIDALEYFSPPERDYVILVAGEFYAGEDDIKAKIEASTHKRNILLHTHFIKDEDVKLYFSAADWVIQPYRQATQSGVTPLAYHFDVPMIVTNVGNLPAMVPESIGIVVEPNAKAIAAGMAQTYHFNMMTFHAAIEIEKKKYSWETFTKGLFSS